MMIHRTLRLPKTLDDEIQALAHQRKVSFTNLARELLSLGLKEEHPASQPQAQIPTLISKKILAASLENLLLSRALAENLTSSQKLVIQSNQEAAALLSKILT